MWPSALKAKAHEVLEKIEKLWKKFAPENAFEYSFLDEDYGKMYDAEKRLASIFAVFAGLAIIIACLGLFALAAFTAEQRTKEIGIRKTLGASVNSIVFLLSREYGKLVLIAFVLARLLHGTVCSGGCKAILTVPPLVSAFTCWRALLHC